MIAPHSIVHQRLSADSHDRIAKSCFSSAHLVGICGAGMKALAEMLLGLGWKVTGSDLQSPHPVMHAMRERGVRIHSDHRDSHLPQNVDVLVYSPAVGPSNPERRMAARLGVPQMSYSQMLGHLMEDRIGVCIAGTHGKSTTTAMTASVLCRSHRSASAIIGAQLCGSGISGWAGEGELFVIESCEYQRSFLDLTPRYAAILGIEPDHFDCYDSFEETQAAFALFAEKVEEGGVMLIHNACPVSADVVGRTSAEIITFSLQQGADWWATDQRQTAEGTRFRVFFHGEYFSEISLQLRGDHNVSNALAAIALSHHAGATALEIRESLAEFSGIRRRYEKVGSWRGVTLIDDYAHHPTEIQSTLKTARAEFPHRRIWCVFQPHQVSRTEALMSEFSGSFSSVDEVLIAPVFAARETPDDDPLLLADELTSRIVVRGGSARFLPSLDQIIATLEDEARPGDVLITMGAGDIDRVHHEFTRRVQRRHSA